MTKNFETKKVQLLKIVAQISKEAAELTLKGNDVYQVHFLPYVKKIELIVNCERKTEINFSYFEEDFECFDEFRLSKIDEQIENAKEILKILKTNNIQ